MTNIVLDTIAALVSAASNAVSLTGVSVVDGPRVSSESDFERLFIGVNIDPAIGLAAEGTDRENSLPGVIIYDEFDILCVAEKWSGSAGSVSPLAVRAFEIRDAVKVLIRPDSAGRVLGVPSLQSARISSWYLYQSQTSKGPYAGLQFRITCIARPSTS